MSKEKEWLESFGVFGIGKDDGQKIIQRLGLTLLREHEKHFGNYWRHTFDPPFCRMNKSNVNDKACVQIVGTRQVYMIYFSC